MALQTYINPAVPGQTYQLDPSWSNIGNFTGAGWVLQPVTPATSGSGTFLDPSGNGVRYNTQAEYDAANQAFFNNLAKTQNNPVSGTYNSNVNGTTATPITTTTTTTPTLAQRLAGIQAGYTPPTSTYATQLADLATKKAAEQTTINTGRQAVLDAMNPTTQETQAQSDLAAIQAKQRNFDLATQAGVDTTAAQAIPMPTIIGQQQNILNNAARISTSYANQAQTTSDLLKTLQTNRQGTLTKAQTSLGFANDDMATILGMEADFKTLSKEERSYANDILTQAIDAYAGTPSSKLDVNALAQLTGLSQQTGMPIDIILKSIDAATAKMTKDLYIATNNAGVVTAINKATGKVVWQSGAGVENARVGSSSGSSGGSSNPYNATVDANGDPIETVPVSYNGQTVNVPQSFDSPQAAADWLKQYKVQNNDALFNAVADVLDTGFTLAGYVKQNLRRLLGFA